MKSFIFLAILLIFNFLSYAHEKIERFILNFVLYHTFIIYTTHYKHKYIINTEFEILVNFQIFNKYNLSFGIVLQYVEYYKLEDEIYFFCFKGLVFLLY